MKKGETLKHGDLVLVDSEPRVVVVIEGVFLLVEVLTFIDNFDLGFSDTVYTREDVMRVNKDGYGFQIIADRDEYEGDKIYDELFDQYCFVSPSQVLTLGKNID